MSARIGKAKLVPKADGRVAVKPSKYTPKHFKVAAENKANREERAWKAKSK